MEGVYSFFRQPGNPLSIAGFNRINNRLQARLPAREPACQPRAERQSRQALDQSQRSGGGP